MRQKARRKDSCINKALHRSFLALVIGLFGAALFLASGLAEALDRELYDFRAGLSSERKRRAEDEGSAAPGGATSTPVELVFVDQYSLAWVEENLGFGWPWPGNSTAFWPNTAPRPGSRPSTYFLPKPRASAPTTTCAAPGPWIGRAMWCWPEGRHPIRSSDSPPFPWKGSVSDR